ncbi:unnamed protein product [Hymenolepis diminuta]|uniref:Uncharacterized protein n=1 Tax=Hymenolepis diminuta TaxID=6216 RepID=A0A564YJK6_HYMDI|nr:unnamed protein product [Hymenolepis diminuta]
MPTRLDFSPFLQIQLSEVLLERIHYRVKDCDTYCGSESSMLTVNDTVQRRWVFPITKFLLKASQVNCTMFACHTDEYITGYFYFPGESDSLLLKHSNSSFTDLNQHSFPSFDCLSTDSASFRLSGVLRLKNF